MPARSICVTLQIWVKSYSWTCNSNHWEKRIPNKKSTYTGHECYYFCSPSVQRKVCKDFSVQRKSLEGFYGERKNSSCSLRSCMIALFPVHQVSSEMTCQGLKTSLTFEPHCFVPILYPWRNTPGTMQFVLNSYVVTRIVLPNSDWMLERYETIDL